VATQFAFESITPHVEVPTTIVAALLLAIAGATARVPVGSAEPSSPQAVSIEAMPTRSTVVMCFAFGYGNSAIMVTSV
jgi:hypothetical protein